MIPTTSSKLTGQLVCGIDLGTTAVRVMVCDLQGKVRTSASRFLKPVQGTNGRREQDARDWWEAVRSALREATSALDSKAIGALSVDATSGTVVLVDRNLDPIGPALMYHDGRAVGYGRKANEAAGDFVARHGYHFKDNFALPKMLWWRDHDPSFGAAWKILHQSDFINARLIGAVPATDWSNALKSGCDLLAGGWARFISERLAFPMEKLPEQVVAPGAKLGEVCAEAAHATGLQAGTPVVAGATDGTASLFASGASQPGDFNTTLGSTLVVKGISLKIVRDPDGVVYCHRHPSGFWLPGGAGNVGCAPINRQFAPDPTTRGRILRELDEGLDRYLPCPILTYPLGELSEERFPFRKCGLGEWMRGRPTVRQDHYAAMLQAVAFIERWCLEKLESLGANAQRIFSTGGGSRSSSWCRLRADVLGKTILCPAETETALGAAVLAASHLCGSFEDASSGMVRITDRVEPGSRDFEDLYRLFRQECRDRWGVA
jgi:D-ribulokinase